MRRAFRILAVAIAAVALPVAPSTSAARPNLPVQPGAPFVPYGATPSDPVGAYATLGFVFADDQRQLYITAPAHAWGRGDPLATPTPDDDVVSVPGLGPIGKVVLWELDELHEACGPGERCIDDIAIVRLDVKRRHVSASVRHWGGPTGIATSHTTIEGSTVLFYGQGDGIRDISPARRGVLVRDDDYTADITGFPVSNGDSGGPFVYAPTGQALAMWSGGLDSEATPIGFMSITRVVEYAAENDLRLEIITAPLSEIAEFAVTQ